MGKRGRGLGRAALLTALVVALVSGPAAAEREYDFAQALWKRGYRDLAIEQYQKVLALEGASPEEKARAHFDLASIYQEEADLASAAAQRQSLLDKAEAELAEALKAAGKDVVLVFASRQQQALLLQNNAQYLAGLLSRPDFKGDRDQTKQKALAAFDQSVTAFRTLADDAKALISDIEKQPPPGHRDVVGGLQNERVNAALRALWSDYYAALLFDSSADLQYRQRLEKARDGFAQFAKEWDGFLVSLYGHLGEGACWLKLADQQKAQEKFTLVLAVPPTSGDRELRAQALIYRAASFNATDQSTRALEDLNTALRAFPQPERVEIGQQALIEKAKALEKLAHKSRSERPNAPEWKGLVRQALACARSVAARPGPYTGEAVLLIPRLLASVGLTEAAASPDEALGIAQLAFNQKDYEGALSGYRRALELAQDPNAPAVVRAWFGIGRCHYYRQQYREAAIVFEHVGRSFVESAEGPRAAYLAVQCWTLAYRESKHQAERRAGLRSLAGALARYGDDPRIAELRLLHGQLLVQENRYEEALREFRAVPEGAAGHARAQYEAGMCAWNWFVNLLRRDRLGEDKGKAQYQAAVTHLEAYLSLVKDANDEEEQQRRGTARVVLATIHNDIIGDPKAALAFLEFEFPEDLKAQVLPLRLKALIQERRVEEALDLLKRARDAVKADPKRLEEVLRSLGQALDEHAEALRKKGDRAAYLAAATRTADFLLGVLRDNPEQDAATYQFVASRLIAIGRFQDATEVLKQLIARFGKDPKEKSVVLGARLSLVECLMGARSWDQAVAQLQALQRDYPDSARLKSLLATCYIERGQPDQGIPILADLFLKIHLPGTRPWYEAGLALARAYEKTGQTKRALGVTTHVKVLHERFWEGRDQDNVDLAEQYKELHRRCGG